MTAGYRPGAVDQPDDGFWWAEATPTGPDCMFPECPKDRQRMKSGTFKSRFCQGHSKQKDRHGLAGMKPLRGAHGKTKPMVKPEDRPCTRCKAERCKECDHLEFTLVNTQRKLVSGELKYGIGRRCLCCKRKHARKPHVREYQRRYYRKTIDSGDGTRERMLEEGRVWRSKNRERINARHRERMASDPEYAERCKEQRRAASARRVQRMRDDPEFREGENAIRRMKSKEKQ